MARHRRSAATESSRPPGPTRVALWVRASVIVLLGILSYANTLSAPFILDDEETITTNEHIRQWWPPSAVLFPAREVPTAGRPVVNMTFAANYAAGGLDVRGYHLVNIAIHIACGLLLFGVVRRTLMLPSLVPRFGESGIDVAWAAALLWLVHPLQTEAVDYVTQRTELLMGLFYLLTLYASIRGHEHLRWRVAAVVSCLVGMACKESMVTAPLMVVLFDRVFVFESLGAAWRARWRLYAALAATWTLLAALLVSGPRSGSAGFATGVTSWTYLLNQAGLIVQYLKLTFWPGALVILYGNPRALTLGDVLPSALLLVALLAVTILALVVKPKIGFLGAWFFVTLAPTSSVVPIATEVGAERRMYLPLAAIVVVVVIGARLLWEQLRGSVRLKADATRAVGLACVAVVTAALMTGTLLRNREYSSAVSLARSVVERWPTARAQHWLGAELIAAGQHDEGIANLREALAGDPRVHYTLGMALFKDGQLDDALSHLRAFVAAEPLRIEVPSAHETIGRALESQGRYADAVAEFRTELRMTPANADIHGLLADALLKAERFDEAAAEYQQYLSRHPASVDALMNLGIARVSGGHADEAVAAFGRAVDVDPARPGARRNLARALLEGKRFADALPHAEAAVRLAPNDAVAHDELGVALAGLRRFDEAVREFQRSLELDPSDADVRAHLASVARAKDGIIAHP